MKALAPDKGHVYMVCLQSQINVAGNELGQIENDISVNV